MESISKTKILEKLKFNKVECHPEKYQENKISFQILKHTFQHNSINGDTYSIQITLHLSKDYYWLDIEIEEAEIIYYDCEVNLEFWTDFDMEDSNFVFAFENTNKKESEFTIGSKLSLSNYFYPNHSNFFKTIDSINCVSGSLKIGFSPQTLENSIKDWKSELSLDISEPTDFKIICENEENIKHEFEFHKNTLAFISDVFKTMLENPSNIEVKNSQLKIIDFGQEIIQILHEIIYSRVEKSSKLLEIIGNPHFLLFVHKYNIKNLITICKMYLKRALIRGLFNCDEIWESIIVFYLIEDWILFEFAIKTLTTLKPPKSKSKEVVLFLLQNPNCAIRIIDILI